MELPPGPGAVPLAPDDVDEAAEIIVSAFVTEPSLVIAFPDPSTREQASRLTYRMLTRLALKHGEVYVTPPPLRAVAVWTPPGAAAPTLAEMTEAGMGDIRSFLPADGWSAMARFIRQLNALHESIAPDPHWHLEFLATDPVHQGRGLGSLLLEGVHARAQADRIPCVLETLTPSNIPFYERRGYRVVKSVDFEGTEHVMYGMRREPTTAQPRRLHETGSLALTKLD